MSRVPQKVNDTINFALWMRTPNVREEEEGKMRTPADRGNRQNLADVFYGWL